MVEKDIHSDFTKISIPPIKEVSGWKEVEIRECGQNLVILNNIDPNLMIVDAQYFKQGINHAKPEQYAREEVATRLIQAARNLPKGYRLLLWDTWRPLEVQ